MFYRALDGSGFAAGIGGGGTGLAEDGSGSGENQAGPKRNSTMNSEIKIAYQPEIRA